MRRALVSIGTLTLIALVFATRAPLPHSSLRAEEKADPHRNLAEESSLARGSGLAAKFVADRGIEKHEAVIFADGFEDEPYTKKWDDLRDPQGKVLSLVEVADEDAPLGKKALRVESKLSANTGGGLTKWFESSGRVFIRFYVKFAEDCDYVHHFVTLRANRGLRGGDRWSGFGGAGILPKGDERFSTALEPWGNWGRFEPPGRWNFYSYWHEMKASPDGKYWGNSFMAEGQDDIPRGRWICAEFLLVHNTPGEPDGEQAYWIDGKLLGHWKGISWRKSPTLMANALTLEAYVTDRWTKHETNVVTFDNLVIAREYIGPAGSEKPSKATSSSDKGRRGPSE